MSARLKSLMVLLAGLLLGAGVGVIVLSAWQAARETPAADGRSLPASADLSVGSLAPDFTLASLDGGEIGLADLRGQVAVLNFWATWCAPCRLEMPALQSRAEKFHGRLRVLAINFDEPEEDVRAFVDELGLTFDVLLDPGAQVQSLYRIRGYPTSYFVDEEGVIRAIHIGLLTEGQLDGYLAELGLED